MVKLYPHQLDAIHRLGCGKILNGDVGSGKSITSLAYYYISNGGVLENGNLPKNHILMKNPKDLYIITTAHKRDVKDWDKEMANFLLSSNPECTPYKNKVVVDSWNNISKYEDVDNAFFIFDEQRVVGYGAWVKSFLKITKKNFWILLSATPGDVWTDYIPVFIANGFYKNKTQFNREHCVYSRYTKYPKIERYLNVERLVRLRNRILINMDDQRKTVPHHEDVWTRYDISEYKKLIKDRWNPWKDEPIKNASELCYGLRRIVNTSESRQLALLELLESHPKAIIFYNFDYELDLLKNLLVGSIYAVSEWNGHAHQPIRLEEEQWVYLVQYNAGCEGWNCIYTDTIIFFSQNYSYKVVHQAAGRINRLNTPYVDLYYYHLKSRSGIDVAISKALQEKKNFNESRWVSKGQV